MKKEKDKAQGPIKVSRLRFKMLEEKYCKKDKDTYDGLAWLELWQKYEIRTNPIEKLFRKIKKKLNPKKYIKLGKIDENDNMPVVKGIDSRVAWSADEYLAVIIREYIRMVERRERHIGAAAFGKFAALPHDKMIADMDSEEDRLAAQRWHELLKETADMFDRYLIATTNLDMTFDYQQHLDKAFDNMKKIFMDLWV